MTLHTAVVVQPLELKQVNAYLASLGKPLAGLHAASKTNILLQELTTTPLMLQVLMLTYYDTSVQGLSQREALLREQIWTDYVQRAVERKGDKGHYPLPVTISWLGYLAREMRQHNQAIFYLEQLQPDWLPEKQRNWYLYGDWLFVGLLFGLGVGLVGGLGMGLVGGLVFWLLFVWARGWGAEIEAEEAKKKLAKKDAPVPWYLVGPDPPPTGGLYDGLVVGGLCFGSIAGLFLGLIAGLLAGLGAGLLTGLRVGLGVGLLTGLRVGLGVGLLAGLIGVLGVGLLTGWYSAVTEPFSGSSSETALSLLKFTVWLPKGLGAGLAGGLGAGLVGGLGVGLLFGLRIGLLFGLHIGLGAGLFFGLLFGLDPVVRYYLTRFWLQRTHTFPWRAGAFLEDATDRVLLLRVGGGYSFAHRLLLDYFADLNVQTPLARGVAQTKSASVQTKAPTSADES